MRFFTKQLWSDINSSNKNTRHSAEEQWKKADSEYLKEFQEVKKYLPSVFLNAFISRNGFHDYEITYINLYEAANCKYDCDLRLTNGFEQILLTLHSITTFSGEVQSLYAAPKEKLSWGYCEFSKPTRRTLSLSIICDIQSEFMFEFETISMRIIDVV